MVLGALASLWGGSGGKALWYPKPMLRFKVIGILWALSLGYSGVLMVLMVQNSQVTLQLFGNKVSGDIWVIGGVIIFFLTTKMSSYRKRILEGNQL